MALYQRGPIWYADYYVNGQRIQESTHRATRREAEKFLAERLSQAQRGYLRPNKVLLADLGERYMAHAKLHKRSWPRDQQLLTRLESLFGPQCTLPQITALRLEDYQQVRAEKAAPATVNRELALLKHMVNLAKRWEMFEGTNPVALVTRLREGNLRLRVLSEEEEAAVLGCSPPYLQDLIVFACNTGLRSGDIFRLRWEEVDREAGWLHIVSEKTRRELDLPLNEAAAGVVEAWWGMRKCEYVFYNPSTGERFKDVKTGLKVACRRAGVKDVNWHTLRHTFASRLLRKGADLVTVKEFLGHSTVVTTMRYAHTNLEAKSKAVARLSTSDKVVTVPSKRPKSAA